MVHFSDWPDGGPQHVDDRASPGEGRLPLKRMLAEVEATGFSGPYCLEILSALELPDSLCGTGCAGPQRESRGLDLAAMTVVPSYKAKYLSGAEQAFAILRANQMNSQGLRSGGGVPQEVIHRRKQARLLFRFLFSISILIRCC